MTSRVWAVLVLGLALTACEGADRPDSGGYAVSEQALNDQDFVTVTGNRIADDGGAPAPAMIEAEPRPAAGGSADAVAERLIAYRYNYQLETPRDATEPLIEAHRQACLGAGPETCQVVNANIYAQGDRGAAGSLALRAVPAWIETFRDGLAGEIDAAGGRILRQSQSADDLTASIYDAEARLTAKRTLRTRLTALLESPGASVEELVSVERELARLQGEIEGAEAQLRVMRGRVSMSDLTLNYTSRLEPVSRGAFEPLGRALRNLAGNFASGLANVITFIASALPWLIVIVPVFWLLGRWLRGLWRKRKAEQAAGQA